MSPFRRTTPSPEPTGRRRPSGGSSADNRPQAFSYYAQRSGSQLNTGRGQGEALEAANTADDTHHDWWQHRAVVSFGAIVVLAGLVYLLALSGDPKIVTLTAGGNAYFLQDKQVYQQAAAKSLHSSFINTNKLTVDTAKVAKDLETQYPEVNQATVAVPLIGHQATVYVEPNKPSFILTTTENSAYLLDENGRAVVSVSQITDPGELSVPTVQDKSAAKVTLGGQALPSTTINFLQSFLSYLDAATVDVSNIILPPALGEADIYIKGTPYFVKCNLEGEVQLQAGTFLATKHRLEKDKVKPSQYIDVRVPGRAYYR